VQRLIRLRLEQPVLQRRKFFQGRPIRGLAAKDISWYEPSGDEMTDDAWDAGFVRSVGVCFAGGEIDEANERGEPIVGDTLLLLLNSDAQPVAFRLPARRLGESWQRLLDTADVEGQSLGFPAGSTYNLEGRSLAVFRRSTGPSETAGT
jgi:isoamylase